MGERGAGVGGVRYGQGEEGGDSTRGLGEGGAVEGAGVGVEGCSFGGGVDAEEGALEGLSVSGYSLARWSWVLKFVLVIVRTNRIKVINMLGGETLSEAVARKNRKKSKKRKHTNSIHGPVATPIHFTPSQPSSLSANASTCFLASRFGWNSGALSTIASFKPSPAYSVGKIHFTPALAAASMRVLCSPMAMKLRAKIAASTLWKAEAEKDGEE